MRRFIPLLALLSLAFAPAPLPKRHKGAGDLDKLQGTWVLTWEEAAGEPYRGPRRVIVIKGSRFRFLDEKNARVSDWSLTLDATSGPKRFDMTDLDRPASSLWGDYCVEGDVLKTSYTWQQGERPRDVNSHTLRRIFSVYQRLNR
jgi:uncharacterized protein (TIGR03067 family)